MPDAHKNFAISSVATAPSPASTGTTLVVTAGDGAKFPAAPFYLTVWPAGAIPLTTNAEIVRVTAVSTDTLTITRAQESTTARNIVVGDQVAQNITAATLEQYGPLQNFDVKAYGAKGDGVTDDSTAIAAAVAACVAAGGGVVYFPPSSGFYIGTMSITANVPMLVLGYGATLRAPGPSVTMLTVNNGQSGGSAQRITIEGLNIKGTNDYTCIGILVQDTTRVTILRNLIQVCLVGIKVLNATANSFCESLSILSANLNDVLTGIQFVITGGTVSFDQTHIDDVGINNTNVGISLPTNANLVRFYCNATVWVGRSGTSNGVAMYTDADMTHTWIKLGAEKYVSAAGGIGFQPGPNATGFDKGDVHLHLQGSLSPIVDTTNMATGQVVVFRKGPAVISQTKGTATSNMHGPYAMASADTFPRYGFSIGSPVNSPFPGGMGGVFFGPGNALADVTLYRRNPKVMQTDSIFGMLQATTAGAPTYTKGYLYFDTTLNKLRVAGATAWETVDTNTSTGEIVYDVKNYGAKGDGTTVDSTSIQNAVNAAIAAGGGTVFVPTGTYVINNVFLGTNVTLAGAGMGASVLKMNPAAASGDQVVRVSPGGTASTNVTVRDLTIDGNQAVWGANSAQKGYGYYLGQNTAGLTSKCSVLNVEIKNCKTYAMDILFVDHVLCHNVYVHDNGYVGGTGSNNSCDGFTVIASDVILEGCTSDNNSNSGYNVTSNGADTFRTKVIGCNGNGNNNSGITFGGDATYHTSDCSVVGGAYNGSVTGPGVQLFTNTQRTTISGVSARGNAQNGVVLHTAVYNSIVGNNLSANATAASTNPEIQLNTNSLHNTVAGNTVNGTAATAAIQESSGSDYNSITGNNVTSTSTPVIVVAGAHSMTSNNVGFDTAAGTGDMVLSAAQTVTGAKTFNAGTLLDKGEVLYDVKAYGAKGDGTTVDTAAVQSAVAAALASGGGTVFFPEGTYVMSNVTFGSNLTVEGAGMGNTILLMDPASASGAVVCRVAPASSSVTTVNCVVQDLTIDGNKGFWGQDSNQKGYGYYLGQSTNTLISHCKMLNVEIRNCLTYSFDVERVTGVTLQNCWAHDNGYSAGLGTQHSCDGFTLIGDDITAIDCRADNNSARGFLVGQNANTWNRNKLLGCSATGNNSHGVIMGSDATAFMYDSSIIGGSFLNNNGAGIEINTNAQRCAVQGVTCTGNALNGIRVVQAAYNAITGNTLYGNAVSGSTNPEIYLLSASTHNTVTGNAVNGTIASKAISEQDSSTDYNSITGNNVTAVASPSMQLFGAHSLSNNNVGYDSAAAHGTGIVVDPTAGNGNFTDIQSALNSVSASGGTVYVNDGTYTVTSPLLVMQSNTRIMCSGGAVIQCNGATVPTLLKPNATGLSRIYVLGGKWLQTNATAQAVGMDFSDTSLCVVAPTRIEAFGTGIRLDDTTNQTFYNTFREIQLFDCNTCIAVGVGATSTQPNDNWFYSMRCRPKVGGAGYGVRIADARGLTFVGLDVESATATGITGISLEQNATSLGISREITFINPWVENNATGLNIGAGSARINFIGGSITSNTTDIVDNGTDTVFLNTSRTGNRVTQLGSGTLQDSGSQTYNVKAYGAKGDGATDDKVAIEAAIAAAAAAGGGTVFFPTGTYMKSGMSTIPSNITLTGTGWGSVIKRTNTQNVHMFENANTSTGNTGIEFIDIKFDGNALNQTSNHQIWWGTKVSRSLFTNCSFNSSSGLVFSAGIGNIVNGCFFTTDLDNAAAIAFQGGCSYNTISDNEVTLFSVAFNMDDTTGATYNILSGNNLHDDGNVSLGRTGGDAIILGGTATHHNIITGNTVDTFGEDGIRLTDNGYQNTVVGNTVNNIKRYSIVLATANNYNTISGNVVTNGLGNGVFVDGGSMYNTIANNEIYNQAGRGVYLNSTTSHNNVQDNIIYSCSTAGIYDAGSGGSNQILGNKINGAGVTTHGIYLLSSSNNVVTGNIAKNNTSAGIRLQTTVSGAGVNNIFSSNRIFDDQGTKTQIFGINEVSGTFSPDFSTYVGNDVTGNKTTAALLVGANNVVGVNVGIPNNQPAAGLVSATTTVGVSAAAAPASGQVLTATSPTAATWQTPAGGGGVSKGYVIAMAAAL